MLGSFQVCLEMTRSAATAQCRHTLPEHSQRTAVGACWPCFTASRRTAGKNRMKIPMWYLRGRSLVTAPAGTPTEKEHRQREEADDKVRSTSGAGQSGKAAKNVRSPHSPPWPAYEASVLYTYPHSPGLELSGKELADLCFPHKV